MIWPGIGEPLVSIGLKDRDSCDSSGSVWSLKVETCLLFWLCGIDGMSPWPLTKLLHLMNETVDPVDCVDSSSSLALMSGQIICRY